MIFYCSITIFIVGANSLFESFLLAFSFPVYQYGSISSYSYRIKIYPHFIHSFRAIGGALVFDLGRKTLISRRQTLHITFEVYPKCCTQHFGLPVLEAVPPDSAFF
jgi:hypothetical protein